MGASYSSFPKNRNRERTCVLLYRRYVHVEDICLCYVKASGWLNTKRG